MSRLLPRVLAAAALTAAAAGLARAQPAAARSEAAAVARARADSMRLPYTAADVRFMSAMIGHHAQAVEMSRLAPGRAASPAVRTLAERIINAQQDEIAIMQRWLRDRRQPVPAGPAPAVAPAVATAAGGHDAHAGHTGHAVPAAPTAPAHDTQAGHEGRHGAGHGAHGAMPGMLSEAQLRQLAAARGPEFDRLFLSSMIRHHQGATSMVRDLFATTGAGQDELVFKFASDVNVDQTTEIARMQRMLAALLVEGPPPAP